jgi:hypothetical protein
MACPQMENKLVGVKFPVHGVINHVYIRQRGFGLAEPKSALSSGTIYSHTLVWLPKVTKKTCLGMRLNLQVF